MSSWDNTVKVYENDSFVRDYAERNLENDDVLSLVKNFVKRLHAKDFVVDLGCGHGRDVRYLADEGIGRVLGIDFSARFVEKAEELTDSTKYSNVEYMVGDMRNLKFLADETVDGIWCLASLLALNEEDSSVALHEMHRVLRSRGKIALSMKCGVQGERTFAKSSIDFEIPITQQLWEESVLIEFLVKHNFTVEKIGNGRRAMAGEDEVYWTSFILTKN